MNWIEFPPPSICTLGHRFGQQSVWRRFHSVPLVWFGGKWARAVVLLCQLEKTTFGNKPASVLRRPDAAAVAAAQLKLQLQLPLEPNIRPQLQPWPGRTQLKRGHNQPANEIKVTFVSLLLGTSLDWLPLMALRGPDEDKLKLEFEFELGLSLKLSLSLMR